MAESNCLHCEITDRVQAAMIAGRCVESAMASIAQVGAEIVASAPTQRRRKLLDSFTEECRRQTIATEIDFAAKGRYEPPGSSS